MFLITIIFKVNFLLRLEKCKLKEKSIYFIILSCECHLNYTILFCKLSKRVNLIIQYSFLINFKEQSKFFKSN